MVNFGDDKIPDTLMLELFQIKMNNKERIGDFNLIYTTPLNKFPSSFVPMKDMQIRFYSRALPLTTTPFIIMYEKHKH